MSEDVPLSELRPRLVAAMLAHVPFDGWTATALAAGAADAGIDTDIAAMALPDAPAMITAYIAHADAQMAEAMAGTHNMKVRDRIRQALRVRFEAAAPHKEAVRRALAILAQPQHAALSARTLWGTADAIWRAAGDTATDYNHYTKRAILSAVYSSSLLAWLEDESEGHADTLAFIDRRIDGVMRFEKTKARLLGIAEKLPDPARFLGRLRYPTV